MGRVVIGKIFVSFIGDVVEISITAEVVDLCELGLWIDGAGGIVRRNSDDGARAWCDGGFDGGQVELVVGQGGDGHSGDVGEGEGHVVVEVVGRLDDDLVAWIGDGEDGVVEGDVRACGDDYISIMDIIFDGEFLGDGFFERGDAGDGLVLVLLGVGHAFGEGLKGLRRRGVADDALA